MSEQEIQGKSAKSGGNGSSSNPSGVPKGTAKKKAPSRPSAPAKTARGERSSSKADFPIEIATYDNTPRATTDTGMVAERRLQLALDGARIGTWEIDIASGHCTFDERIADLLVFNKRECNVDEFMERIHPGDREGLQKHLRDAIKGERDYDVEFRVLLPDGTLRWLAGRAMLLRNPDQEPERMIGINFDITRRKRAESELRDAKAQLEERVDEQTRELRVITENVPALFAYVDRKLRYRFINRLYEDKFCMAPGEFLGRPVKEVYKPANYQEIEPRLKAALKGEEQTFEINLDIPRDGNRVVRAHYLPRKNGDAEVDGVFVLASDITTERRLQQEVLAASEREKERIGRDLHDSVCQELGGIGMFGKALAQSLRQRGAKEAEDAELLIKQLNEATQKARKLARGLSPVVLENRSLVEALEDLADNVTGLFDAVECTFSNRVRDLELSENVATQLYFIGREAAYNATRHAEPQHVAISLEIDGEHLVLSVKDDGGAKKENLNEGLGIRSMRYRARTLGGNLHILDNPDEDGLWVSCRLNLRNIR